MKIININLSDINSIVLKGLEYIEDGISSTINIFTNYGTIQIPVIYCDANEIMDEYEIYFIDAIKNLFNEFKLRDKEPGIIHIAIDMQDFLENLNEENKLRLELGE